MTNSKRDMQKRRNNLLKELRELLKDYGVQYITHCFVCKQPTTCKKCTTHWCVNYMK